MKKLLWFAVAAIVISAAAWSTLWFAGRDEVGARLDAEIERVRAQGCEIEHGAREIGGFPFGYAVTYRDVAVRYPAGPNGAKAAYVLPWITAEMTAADVDRIVARFPEKFRLEIPVDPAARAETPTLPEQFNVDIEADSYMATVDGVLSPERDVTLTARSLLVAMGERDQDLKLAIDLQGIEVAFTLPPPGNHYRVPSRALAERIEYGMAIATDGDTPVVLEGSLDAVRMTGEADMVSPRDALEMMFTGEATSTVAYQTGAAEGMLNIPENAGQWSGSIRFSSASTAGTAEMEQGVIRLEASGQANRIALAPAVAGGQGPGLGGEISAVELAYALPIAPSKEMVPLTFRLALDQLALDESLWALLDADGALPHDPASLVIDVETNARLTRRIDHLKPGQMPPVELGNATIRAADLHALGATVSARGDVEFLPVIQLPVGKITVTLTDAFQTVNRLAKAGLLTPEMAQTAIVTGTGFTVEGTAPGERVSVIELTPGGIVVNGIRVR